jgi:hypothetical protein
MAIFKALRLMTGSESCEQMPAKVGHHLSMADSGKLTL